MAAPDHTLQKTQEEATDLS